MENLLLFGRIFFFHFRRAEHLCIYSSAPDQPSIVEWGHTGHGVIPGMGSCPDIWIFVASEASDPIFKTIHFQYYTLVVLIQIKYFCKSETWREGGGNAPP